MKKLMIAAAGAAVGLGAFATAFTPEAYEMNITLKTTACKAGEGKTVCDSGYTTYRVKANQKIAGLFWGCDCPTIAEPKAFESFDDFGTTGAAHGYVFWDASVKTKDPYETAEFDWTDGTYRILQCINPKCTDCEGLWTLSLSDANDNMLVKLQGAGFGSSKWSSEYLSAYISSMSGNVTGWAFPGSLSYGCAACGEIYTGCSAWAFCSECDEQGDDVPSIAYGTFTLKFKADVAKKYAKGTLRTSILQAYKFSDAVKAYLVKKDAGYDPEPTERTAAEKTYDAAKADYTAKAAAYNTAVAEWEAATTTVFKANADYKDVKKSAAWIAGTNEIVKLAKEMGEMHAALAKLSTNPNYIATWNYCCTNGTNYAVAVKEYVEKSVALKYYNNTITTQAVETAKIAKANAYLALDNAMSAAPGGDAVKKSLMAAVDAFMDAAEAYYDKAAQYISRDSIMNDEGVWVPVNFATCKTTFWMEPTYTVCFKGIDDVRNAALKEQKAKDTVKGDAKTAMDDAKKTMDTAKIICDATGGSCN